MIAPAMLSVICQLFGKARRTTPAGTTIATSAKQAAPRSPQESALLFADRRDRVRGPLNDRRRYRTGRAPSPSRPLFAARAFVPAAAVSAAIAGVSFIAGVRAKLLETADENIEEIRKLRKDVSARLVPLLRRLGAVPE